MKELQKFYDKYGHLDEPLKVYFDEYNGNYIIIEQTDRRKVNLTTLQTHLKVI